MFKQICTILLGIIFLTAFTHSAPLSNNTEIKNLIFDPDNDISIDDPESFELIRLLKRDETSFTNDQRRFQQEVLTAHNNYRKCHGASPLTLDDNLSRSAQQYAEYLDTIKRMVHSDPNARDNAGENLSYMYSSNSVRNIKGNLPTDSWYKEIKDYNFKKGGFSMTTGHFTQLVWKSSQRLGVGIGFAGDGRSVYIVARYSPAGNFGGQYQQNVSPRQC